VRLEKEIAAVNAEWRAASVEFGRSNSLNSPAAIIGIIVSLIVGMFAFFGLVGRAESEMGTRILSLFFLAVAGAGLIYCIKRNVEAGKSFDERRKALWRPYAERLHKLEVQIAKNRHLLE